MKTDDLTCNCLYMQQVLLLRACPTYSTHFTEDRVRNENRLLNVKTLFCSNYSQQSPWNPTFQTYYISDLLTSTHSPLPLLLSLLSNGEDKNPLQKLKV